MLCVESFLSIPVFHSMAKVSFGHETILAFLAMTGHHPLSYSECGQFSVFRSCLLFLLENSQVPSYFLLTVPVLKLRQCRQASQEAAGLPAVFLSLREWKKKEAYPVLLLG